MDFKFAEEQEMLRKSIHEFMRRECPVEYVRRCDEEEIYPQDLFDKMAKLGWMGLPFPERYGGSGGTDIDLVILIEELGYFWLMAAIVYGGSVVFGGESILAYGNEEQKNYYLPRLSRGEIQFALSVTEPDAGSDAASITTSAVQDGDDYVINGNKIFCSRAQHADYIIMSTLTDKEVPRHKGITMFIIDRRSPGIQLRKIRTMSLKSYDTNEVFLDNVRVSAQNVLGGLNQGWGNLMKTVEFERIYIASMSVGAAQSVIDDAVKYANERVQFGRPIGKFQLIRAKIADMQTEVDAARLLTYRAAWLHQERLPCNREAAMAKLFASEAYKRTSDNGVQILGGYGLTLDYDMQRHFRDSRVQTIGGGSSEIMRLLIGGQVLGS